MVRRTQEAGELRPDITAEDVPTVVAMITTASVALNHPPARRRGYPRCRQLLTPSAPRESLYSATALRIPLSGRDPSPHNVYG